MSVRLTQTFEFEKFDDAVEWMKEAMGGIGDAVATVNLSGFTANKVARMPEHWRVSIEANVKSATPAPKALPEPQGPDPDDC